MLDSNLSTAQIILISIIPVLFAIVIHEIAHGWAAYRLGDKTAYMLGRLSLNPIKHIDPVGTILIPIILYMSVGFVAGYAKPVPIDWRNFSNPKRDTAIVAIAGPAANLLMAIAWAILAFIVSSFFMGAELVTQFLLNMAIVGIFVNILLMIINLIPIPPTDGGRIAVSLLPNKFSYLVSKIEPYGLYILLILMLTGILGKLISPIINAILYITYSIVGL